MELNEREKIKIFYEVKEKFEKEDAERQLFEYLGYDPDEEDAEQVASAFAKRYGISLAVAVDLESESEIISDIVERYNHITDCNIAENISWQQACEFVLNDLERETTEEPSVVD